MSKQKHTPGPWQAVACEGYDFEVRGADLSTISFHYSDSQADGQYAKGNAHLIAAAPEMLEALKLCLQAFSPWGTNHPAEAAAKAAIAKAEGK